MELPRDVVKKIIRKLDIDDRRKMDIYKKIHIPNALKVKLDRVNYLKSNKMVTFELIGGGYIFIQNQKAKYNYFDVEDNTYTEYDLISGDVISCY